jgi:hypothetical protein
MPRRTGRSGLLAKVAIDEVGERRDGLLRVRAVGANHYRRPLAHAQSQDAQHAFRISHGAILDDFNLRVLEARGGLHEKRGRPRMQANLVRDGQRTFGDRGPSPPSMP